MLTIVKNLFRSDKDASGRKVDRVITTLAAQNKTSIYSWSYIREEGYYENTTNGRRVYTYDLPKNAA
ncbi:hypothetical protein GCM10007916_24280 [Psychromonas marina]|uniref:Uncharacterized protein n=1 Tax=Psychromonas marina TaxID=88364 RepID=A0ABQ6E294_9GAMM|nr:hypothetical protein [Psychromonas marina]GLS91359.1 hypothetical protein GCM10007916_24280 [Psychromonas marina]